MPHRIHKCTDTLYDYAIINYKYLCQFNYELKEWKVIYEYGPGVDIASNTNEHQNHFMG